MLHRRAVAFRTVTKIPVKGGNGIALRIGGAAGIKEDGRIDQSFVGAAVIRDRGGIGPRLHRDLEELAGRSHAGIFDPDCDIR